MELVSGEDTGIFCIQAEHNTNTKDIQPSQGFRRIVVILLQQGIVDTAHNLSGLHRYLHFLFDVFTLLVNEELQTVIFFPKIFEPDFFRLSVGLFHVINKKLFEVASHNPSRTLRIYYTVRFSIPLNLLVWGKVMTITLLDRCPQVFIAGFLLNKNLC